MNGTDERKKLVPSPLESYSHGKITDDPYRALEANHSAIVCRSKMNIGNVLRGWARVLG